VTCWTRRARGVALSVLTNKPFGLTVSISDGLGAHAALSA
jgi:hypothetical protein